MSRQDFGRWGAELDPDVFARALAALGVLQAASTPTFVWQYDRQTALTNLEAALRTPSADKRRRVPWGLIWQPSFIVRYLAPESALYL
jgi:hypothetical protein